MQKEICNKLECTGCGACAAVCPKKCIEMKQSSEGFAYPEVDAAACINCDLCTKTCHINQTLETSKADFYMGWHKEQEVQLKSSSGGVFTALAQYVFSRGGVAAGAELDSETGEVVHTIITDYAELQRVRSSKYYQSSTKEIFAQVRRYLDDGRYVLFSGVACQIAALKAYLKHKPYEKLITVDVLCHGVASKKTVDAYIQSREKAFGKKIIRYSFRVKGGNTAWENGGSTRTQLFFEDGSDIIEDQSTGTFFKGFNNNLFLRESCYKCHYCGTDRIADFTIADFWGVSRSKVTKEQLKNGVSLILANTGRARTMLPELRQYMEFEEIGAEEAIPYNKALVQPNTRPADRDRYFAEIDSKSYDSLIHKYYRKYYIKLKLKRLLSGILGEKNFAKLKSGGKNS